MMLLVHLYLQCVRRYNINLSLLIAASISYHITLKHCLILKVNLISLRHRWVVHKGRSSEEKDLIFGVQRSHPLDMRPRLDVFMATHMDKGSSFQLVGSHIDNSCKVYQGDTIIAEVRTSFHNCSSDFNVQLCITCST